MNHLRSSCQVKARTRRFQRKNQHFDFRIILELAHHFIALILRATAVIEICRNAKFAIQSFLQELAHFAELGKDNCLFTLILNRAQQIQKHGKLSRIFDLRLPRLQISSRMVANLLQRQNHLENQALPLEEAMGIARCIRRARSICNFSQHLFININRSAFFKHLQFFHELVERTLVQRRLRARESSIFILLNFIGQVADNALVRLHAT